MSDFESFLITTGRTLSQMALYSPEHPSVKESIVESHRLISSVLNEVPEVVLSISENKLIVNGKKPEGITDTALRPFMQLLNAHNLHSLSFIKGITIEEMIPLFRMAAGGELKRQGINPVDFFAEHNVAHIRLNQTRYAKIGEDDTIASKGEVGVGDGEGGGGRAEFEDLTLTDMLRKMVDKSVIDPTDRAHVYNRALSLVKKQIDDAVEKVVVEFNRERTKLTNERERTEGVINKVADGVVVVDENGHVLMMNPAAEQIYGVKLGESLGRPLWEGVQGEQMVALAKDLAVPTDRPLVKEVEIRGSQEAQKVLRASAATIQDTEGHIVGMVSVLSDVTKQKELNRLQNEFMANVTHDLRAPIHAVKLAVEAILEGSAGTTTSEQQKMLSVASRNIDRLSRLIDDLLDFSKIESGSMEIHAQVIEIESLLKEAVASMETWAKSRGVKLLFEESPSVPAAFADSDRILQVVNNLISNAIKFTPTGGQITLRAKKHDEPGKKMVLVEVQDSGKGISQEDQKRIFERFIQLNNQEKLDVRGTGLGLSICRAFVDLHKGRLWVQSPPPAAPNGSLFQFTLPAVEKSTATQAPMKPREEKTTQAVKPLEKKSGFWSRFFRFKSILFAFCLLAPIVAQARPYWGTVRRVLEPNLLQLSDGTKIRLLGIVSPAKGEPFYAEAMSANRMWSEKKELKLRYGLQERDVDGVWLVYAFVDGVFLNEELVKQGLALVSRLPNEEEYLPRLIRAEREAHANRRGQWQEIVIDKERNR